MIHRGRACADAKDHRARTLKPPHVSADPRSRVGVWLGGGRCPGLARGISSRSIFLGKNLRRGDFDPTLVGEVFVTIFAQRVRRGLLWMACAAASWPGTCSAGVIANFSFTGGEQTWTVPQGVSSVRIEAAGGGGGGGAHKIGSGGGGATSIFLQQGGLKTLWIVAGGGGGGGGAGNTVSEATWGGAGGSGGAFGGGGGSGAVGADGGGIPDAPQPGGGGPGGVGGDPSNPNGDSLGGGAGGSVFFEANNLDGSTYDAVVNGGYGFSGGEAGENGIVVPPLDGGLPGAGGGGLGFGGGGYSGSGYTGGGGGGGAGGSFGFGGDAAFSAAGGTGGLGSMGGGTGGNGALVTRTFAVNAGDQLSIYVGGGGQSWGNAGDNGWVVLSVPEPANGVLLVTGGLLLLRKKRLGHFFAHRA